MATFTLSTIRDTPTGTAAADVFNGGIGTLQTVDTIDGAGGRDRLDAGTDRNGTPAPTISDVEVLRLQTGGQSVDISNVTGAEVIGTVGDSIIIEQIGTDDLGVRYAARDVQSGTVKLQFEGGALSGASDTLRLQSDGSNVTFTSDSTFDATMDGEQNATEDRLRVENVVLSLSGTDADAQFANQVDLSSFSAIERLTVGEFGEAGPSKITLASTELQTIDARSTSGGLTLDSDVASDQNIFGGSGDDDFKSGSGNDRLFGNAGDDVLTAGSGDNRVFGGMGDDDITSEQGNDVIGGGAGNDTIDSGSGNDRVRGGDGDDRVSAGDGADRVFGEGGDDVLRGNGGNDTIGGGAGNDRLFGGGDDDTLITGAGDDTLTGGGGRDLFFVAGADTGNDTIKDFTLTSNTATNDVVRFEFDGQARFLSSQQSFENFFDANQASGRVTADANTDTVTIQADGGTVTINVTDADFLLA